MSFLREDSSSQQNSGGIFERMEREGAVEWFTEGSREVYKYSDGSWQFLILLHASFLLQESQSWQQPLYKQIKHDFGLTCGI